MATIKKACKGVSYPKSSSVSKRIGSPSKAKKGGSFDLNNDGKTTFKDVLIGRGVLPKTAKKGLKIKKAQNGKLQPLSKGKSGENPKMQMEMEKFKYQKQMDRMKLDNAKEREEAMRQKGIKVAKKGTKMTKKCAYGCK